MNNLNEVLDRYQSADMGLRLNMYLQYREHRDEFILLDMKKNENECASPGSVFFCCENWKSKEMKLQKIPTRNKEKYSKNGDNKNLFFERRLDMRFSSAQTFVRKMKDDKKFRKNFQSMTDTENLWNCKKKEGFTFDEKDLVRAMAECMNELEASC